MTARLMLDTIHTESASRSTVFTTPSRAELSSLTPGASTSVHPERSSPHFLPFSFTRRTSGQKDWLVASLEEST